MPRLVLDDDFFKATHGPADNFSSAAGHEVPASYALRRQQRRLRRRSDEVGFTRRGRRLFRDNYAEVAVRSTAAQIPPLRSTKSRRRLFDW